MVHRQDLNSLTPAQRTSLVNLMLDYIDDAVVADHTTITHNDVHIFTGHRAYIEQMEMFLFNNGGSQFVPLPMWNPANPIPAEFNVVKTQDDGDPRPPLVNLNPNMPLPPEFAFPAVCQFQNGDDLGNAINGWHGGVHGAIGGTMSMFSVASAAPIFWCWHAFLDHVYWDWNRCSLEEEGTPEQYPSQSEHPHPAEQHDGHKTYKSHYDAGEVLEYLRRIEKKVDSLIGDGNYSEHKHIKGKKTRTGKSYR